MLSQQGFRDPEDPHLGIIGVTNGGTGEDLGGTGDVREGVGQQAAGAGLREGDGLLHRAELFDDDGGEAGMPSADKVVPNGVADAPGEIEQVLRGGTAAAGGDARIDHPGVRAEGQHHPGRQQRAHDLLQRHRAKPKGADLDVGLALAGATDAPQPRDDVMFEHRTQFERGPWQHSQSGATSVEENAGGRAARVGQALAADRHGALGEVRRGDLAANEREAFT